MKKRIVGLIVILIVFATMFGIIIGKWKYIAHSNNYVEKSQLEIVYQDGYDKGTFDNRDEVLYEIIERLSLENEQYKQKNEELESKIVELNSLIETLTNQEEKYKQIILNLQLQVNELTGEKQENLKKIDELNSKIAELEEQISSQSA